MKARRRGDAPVALTGSALPALRESRTGELRVGDSESIRESRDRPVGDRNVAAPTATLLFAALPSFCSPHRLAHITCL